MKTRALLVALAVAGLGLAQTPSIRDQDAILNAASFKTPVSPGSLISIFGTNLSGTLASSDTIPLSSSIAGVTVQFVQADHTYTAPLQFIYQGDSSQGVPAQINVQLPWAIVPGGPPVSVTVTRDGIGTSAPATVPVGAFGPGVFAISGLAVAVNNADGTFAWASGAVPGVASHAVKGGDVLIIYATGLGAVDSTIPDGQAPVYYDGTLRNTSTSPTVFVGGVEASLVYSVLSPQFVGVDQLAIVVPGNAPTGDKVALQILQGSVKSPDTTTIAVTK